MSTLSIHNLPRIRALDQAARAAVAGGTGVYPMPALIRQDPCGWRFPGQPGMPGLPAMPYGPPVWHGPAMPGGSGDSGYSGPPKVIPL